MGITPTRRDFVQLLLGAPVAASLAQCSAHSRNAFPPGELRDTGMRRGHQLVRTAVAHLPQTALPHALAAQPIARQHEVIIIGGGAAGLSAAWALRRAGVKDIVVLEHGDVAGGTALGDAEARIPHPWGAHYIVAPMADQADLVELLDDMNAVEHVAADGTVVVDEALRCREPEERIYYRGRWYEGLYLYPGATKQDRAEFNRFLRLVDQYADMRVDGRRAFALPMVAGANPAEVRALDQQSFAAWLRSQGLHSPRLHWLADYACRDDFGLHAEDTSAWAGLFYFAARQKRAGDHAQPVLAWPDGNHGLIRHLAQQQRIIANASVVHVGPHETAPGSPTNAGVDVYAIVGNTPQRLVAKHVICAVPQFIARRIVAGLAQARAQDTLDYGAWAVANVHLRARPRRRAGDFPAAWDNVFYDSPSLGYVTATHQAGREVGETVWTWYYAFTDREGAATRAELMRATHAEWAEVVLADLARAHPDIRPLVTRLDVAFWGHGMIRPRVGSVWAPSRQTRAAPFGNIYFANTDLSGLAIFEEAYAHGRRAAREVLAARAAHVAPTYRTP